MTTVTTNTTPLFLAEVSAGRPARIFRRLRETLAARAERRETFQALRYLTDRELADIGLTQADVNAMR